MNIANIKQRERLYKSIENAYRNLQSYRTSKKNLIRAYIGTDGGRNLGVKPMSMPQVNLVYQVAEAYQTALAYNLPKYRATTEIGSFKGFALRLQSALNNLVKMLHLQTEFQACVLDAFFRAGIFKVAMPGSLPVYTDESPYIREDELPFGARVSGDNWVHDTGVSDLRKSAFMGDTYLVTMTDAKENGLWGSQFANQLRPRPTTEENLYERSEGLSRAHYDNDTDIDDMVRLADIYLPRERLIVTVPCGEDFKVDSIAKPFVRDWEGLPCGPYHTLTFADVPDSAMPYSMAENLAGLAMLYNNILAKMANRALKQKDVFAYSSSAQDDAKRIVQSKDMEVVKVDAKDAVVALKFGGVDPSLLAFDMNVAEIFNRSAGNIETMLGLGPVAPTAAQEGMVGQAVQGRLAILRQRTARFMASVGEGFADLIFDSEVTIPGRRSLGNGYDVDDTWYPEFLLPRKGGARDYQFDIVPESTEYRSSQQQLARLHQNLQATLPLLPVLEAQGTTFNGLEYVKKLAELSDCPEFLDLFQTGGLPIEREGEGGNRLGGNQPREYIRKNVSAGATPQGRQQQQLQSMMHLAGSGGGE